jgi:cysteinyl-tRNA synthetase
MSKSLKNFITIREVLSIDTQQTQRNVDLNLNNTSHEREPRPKYSARQLRFLFLLQQWDHTMNYQRENTMADVSSKEKYFSEFFLTVENVLHVRLSFSPFSHIISISISISILISCSLFHSHLLIDCFLFLFFFH